MNHNNPKAIWQALETHQTKGFLAEEEAFALFHYSCEVAALGPILEIGSYCGKSTVFLAAAAKQANTQVFALDHHRGSEEHQLGEEYFDAELFDEELESFNTLPTFIKTLNLFNCQDWVIPVVTKSQTLSALWQISLSFVFVDGGHSLEAATHDCLAWSKPILPGGIMAVHDIYERPEDGGQAPYLALQRLLELGEFEIVDRVKSLVILRRHCN